MRALTLFACLAAGAVSGCATLEIDDNAEKSGAPFHDVRPYVVVSQAADCSRTASVLSLPDRSKTYFVRPRGGIGENKLSATFSNGLLTTFSQETKADPTGLISTLAEVFGIGGGDPGRGGGEKDAGDTEQGGKGRPASCTPTSWIFFVADDGRLTPAFDPIR